MVRSLLIYVHDIIAHRPSTHGHLKRSEGNLNEKVCHYRHCNFIGFRYRLSAAVSESLGPGTGTLIQAGELSGGAASAAGKESSSKGSQPAWYATLGVGQNNFGMAKSRSKGSLYRHITAAGCFNIGLHPGKNQRPPPRLKKRTSS